jgi:hypothetical protein
MNISEFEREKPTETHKIISKTRKKYENILKNKIVMDDIDATKVMMAEEILEDLEEIFQKFISGH